MFDRLHKIGRSTRKERAARVLSQYLAELKWRLVSPTNLVDALSEVEPSPEYPFGLWKVRGASFERTEGEATFEVAEAERHLATTGVTPNAVVFEGNQLP